MASKEPPQIKEQIIFFDLFVLCAGAEIDMKFEQWYNFPGDGSSQEGSWKGSYVTPEGTTM